MEKISVYRGKKKLREMIEGEKIFHSLIDEAASKCIYINVWDTFYINK